MVSGQVAVTRSSPLELRSAGGHALEAVDPTVAAAAVLEPVIQPVVVAVALVQSA
jgi:hypothetical protein